MASALEEARRLAALNRAVNEAREEAHHAMFVKFTQPFNGFHEGFAVLYEEVDELWEVVRMKNSGPQAERKARARAEAKQVAAMALRLMAELT